MVVGQIASPFLFDRQIVFIYLLPYSNSGYVAGFLLGNNADNI
jgi:hypothetical protein